LDSNVTRENLSLPRNHPQVPGDVEDFHEVSAELVGEEKKEMGKGSG
jgi:hypothetical protein